MDILQMRNKLYMWTTICTIIFVVMSITLMWGFKQNEAYFDTHGRIGVLAENEQQAVNEENSKRLFAKRNLPVTLVDSPQSELTVPLALSLPKEQIVVREEFTQNKVVITLKNAQSHLAEGTEIISDSQIMDAVGIYKQKDDVVIEVFCKDIYAYQMTLENNTIHMQFMPLDDVYKKKVVLYIPNEDRNRFVSEEWKKELDTMMNNQGMKIFVSAFMQETYKEEEVIAFANMIRADAVLGIKFMQDDTDSRRLETVCNAQYFIPEFNSLHAALVMEDIFATEMGMVSKGIREYNDTELLIRQAKIPAAQVIMLLPKSKQMSLEEEYTFHHVIMKAVKETVEEIDKLYLTQEQELSDKERQENEN